MDEIESFLGQEIIMAFSQAFLDWEEATEAKGISIGEQRGISIGQQEHARSLVINAAYGLGRSFRRW